MTDTPSKTTTRRPDCVTEIRMGNTVLTVSGYFKQSISFNFSVWGAGI